MLGHNFHGARNGHEQLQGKGETMPVGMRFLYLAVVPVDQRRPLSPQRAGTVSELGGTDRSIKPFESLPKMIHGLPL